MAFSLFKSGKSAKKNKKDKNSTKSVKGQADGDDIVDAVNNGQEKAVDDQDAEVKTEQETETVEKKPELSEEEQEKLDHQAIEAIHDLDFDDLMHLEPDKDGFVDISSVEFDRVKKALRQSGLVVSAYDRLSNELEQVKTDRKDAADDLRNVRSDLKSEKKRNENAEKSLSDRITNIQEKDDNDKRHLKEANDALSTSLDEKDKQLSKAISTATRLSTELDTNKKVAEYKLRRVVDEARDYRDYVRESYSKAFDKKSFEDSLDPKTNNDVPNIEDNPKIISKDQIENDLESGSEK